MVEKREMSRSGADGKNKTKFRFFDKIEKILSQRPIVTSLCSITAQVGIKLFKKLKYCLTFNI